MIIINFKIDTIAQGKNSQTALFDLLKNSQKPIIIFGAGAEGRSKCSILRKYDIPIQCFADNDQNKADTLIDGLKVINFKTLVNEYPDAYIIIGTWIYADQIIRQFEQVKYKPENIILREIQYNTLDVIKTVHQNFKLFDSAYALFEDGLSQQVFINKLGFWNTLDDSLLQEIQSNHCMYFDEDIITLTDSEFFVDGGGYTGDTYEEFLKYSKDFKKYWFFEPDEHNYKIAAQKYVNNQKLELINQGLWDKPQTLSFVSTGDGSSKLSENGMEKISVTSLDKFITDSPVTFIKIDIEGAEKEALLGAQRIIASFKPKLAVCVYHNFMDMIELPLLMKKLNPSYKLYLRHYSAGTVDTVCYAI